MEYQRASGRTAFPVSLALRGEGVGVCCSCGFSSVPAAFPGFGPGGWWWNGEPVGVVGVVHGALLGPETTGPSFLCWGVGVLDLVSRRLTGGGG